MSEGNNISKGELLQYQKKKKNWVFIFFFTTAKGNEWRMERQGGSLLEGGGTGGKGRWRGKGFGLGKQDLHPAGAVTAPTVRGREDLWLFSYRH